MSDPRELGELAAVVIAADRTADIPALRAIIAAGWVSPEQHHETLNDYGQAVGDLNLAHYLIGRTAALAANWDAEAAEACPGSNHGDGCPDCIGTAYAAELRAVLKPDTT